MKQQLGTNGMNTSELYEYTSQTLSVARQQGPLLVSKSPLYLAVETKFSKYDEGFKKDGKSMLTDPILALDADRDRIVKWLYYTVMGLSFSSNATMVEAATLLLSKLDTYGLDLIRLAYSEESAMIKGILNDCKHPDYAAAVAKAGVQPILDELQVVQNSFDKLFEQRREASEERHNIESASTARRELEAAIRGFRTLVAGMAMAEPTSEWGKANNLLLQLDAEYAKKLRTRATLLAKQKKDSEKK